MYIALKYQLLRWKNSWLNDYKGKFHWQTTHKAGEDTNAHRTVVEYKFV